MKRRHRWPNRWTLKELYAAFRVGIALPEEQQAIAGFLDWLKDADDEVLAAIRQEADDPSG